MHLALRVLALLNALALALPAGWCCLRPDVRAETGKSPADSCCHRSAKPAPRPAPEKEPPPCQKSEGRCCGEVPSVTPPAQQQYTPDLATPAALILADPAAIAAYPNGFPTGADLFPTPSLQVLQCVWRC
jgi:hypothetical protein